MGTAKGTFTVKLLCNVCAVLVAFRWPEAECAECHHLNGRERLAT